MGAHANESAATTSAGDGPHELPPEPTSRHITPAPADFAHPPGLPRFLWATLWIGLAVLLAAVGLAQGWNTHLPH